MRLPSFSYIASVASSSFVRFPLMLIAAFVAAACAITTLELEPSTVFTNIMVTANLGIALFFALAAAAESNAWPRTTRIAANVAAVVALVLYYLTLPDRFEPAARRFVQLELGVLLLCAFLPFARGRHNGFWQFNRALFLRFLTAVLYSAVIYLGLILALFAIDRLLGVSIPDHFYLWLLYVIGFVFNTWVFLGGIPRDIAGLESVTEYPRGLKVFAQYILIPLVVVYLAILTAYLFKIVITTEWPSGWIGWMVSSVAVVGIVALLLVWPVADQRENRWVGTYTRWFFIFMIPAIVMLLLAVQRRIEQYGITEARYFLAVLSVWLAAIAGYFILSRRRFIKVIPVSLCIVAFATSVGPWGAYSVSRRSQTHRLEELLVANEILVDGAIAPAPGTVPFNDQKEISAITHYLVFNHGAKSFERWLDTTTLAQNDSTPRYDQGYRTVREIVSRMGLEYVEAYASLQDAHFNYAADVNGLRVLDGADYMVNLRSTNPMEAPVPVGNTGLAVAWDETAGVVLREGNDVIAAAPVDSMLALIRRNPVWTRAAIPADVMRVAANTDRARLVVYFNVLGGSARDGKPELNYIDADCYVTPVPAP